MAAKRTIFLFGCFLPIGFGFLNKPSRLSLCDTRLSRPVAGLKATSTASTELDEKQLDFTMGYMNKHHTDLLTKFSEAYSELGEIKANRNAFSGGSYKILEAKVVDINTEQLELEVTVKERNKKEPTVERVTVSLDADPINKRDYDPMPAIPRTSEEVNPVDIIVRRLNRLANMARMPAATGKLTQLAIQIGGEGVGELHEDMFLNQVPHNRYVRKYFYDMAAEAALEAIILCSQHKVSNRMKMISMFPEMNPAMDSYRIGTLLELTRTIAIRLAEENLRVRICVQGSLGKGFFSGTPKQLNGVSTILQRMDWQSEEGEENEGMVGNYVNFGAIGKEHVVNAHTDDEGKRVEQDDVFILLCPQSMVGIETSIIPLLEEMVEAVGDRPIILINPDLTDKVSAEGQQSVRGRKQRIEFAESFETVFHFQNIYVSGTSYFPILGAVMKLKPSQPWVALQRRDRVNDGGEVYLPVLSSEEMPEGDVILSTFER